MSKEMKWVKITTFLVVATQAGLVGLMWHLGHQGFSLGLFAYMIFDELEGIRRSL
jgi:hypothetical protein